MCKYTKKSQMLIVIEGLDGSGKSTQVGMLKEYLISSGKELHYLHFPRFDAPVVGEMIAMFLRGDFGSIDQVHPMLVALLYAEDRRDASVFAKDWLAKGNIVLYDRYVYSNIAFQCAKIKTASESELLSKWISKTEFDKFNIPRPDINIFLDVPISFVGDRLSEQRQGVDRDYLEGKSDIHEMEISFQERVREEYLKICKIDSSFIRIDCADADGNMQSAESIFAKIKVEIEKRID